MGKHDFLDEIEKASLEILNHYGKPSIYFKQKDSEAVSYYIGCDFSNENDLSVVELFKVNHSKNTIEVVSEMTYDLRNMPLKDFYIEKKRILYEWSNKCKGVKILDLSM